MILSQSEVAATLFKAARGRGLPLGHADVFVPAAVRALGTYDDVAPEVTEALQGPHICKQTGLAMAAPLAIDALLCGQDEVVFPCFQGFRVLAAMLQNAYDSYGLCIYGELGKNGYILSHAENAPKLAPPKGPIHVSDADWAQWLIWAAETYVPATDQSRLSGAGAGLTDND